MKRRIRILQVIDSIGNAGAETLQRTLAEGIDRSRFELHVCGLRPRPGSITLPALQALGVPTLVLNQHASYDLPALSALVRYIRAQRIDLIHTHLPAADVMGRMAGFLTRRPVVSTIHSDVRELEGETRRLQWLCRWTARLWCRKLVVVSALLRDETASWFGLPLDRVIAIPNGVDTERFRPLPSAEQVEIKRALVGGDYPVVTNVARLVPEKAQDVLLRAARTVVDSTPDVRFVLVGEGPQNENLKSLAGEMGLGSNVLFCGFRSDVDRLLAGSDLFVLSSEVEGMPVAILEAMSAGCPAVATRVGGIPQVLRDGVTGLLVPPANPQALSAALLSLLNDAERRRGMSEAARRIAVSEYGKRAWAQQWEALYLRELRPAKGAAKYSVRSNPEEH